MLTRATNALVRIMLAPECAACDAPLDQPLSGTGVRVLLERRASPDAAVLRTLRRRAGGAGGRCTRTVPLPAPAAGAAGRAKRRPVRRVAAPDHPCVQVPSGGGPSRRRSRRMMRAAGADLLGGRGRASCPCRCIPGARSIAGSTRPTTWRAISGLPVLRALRRRAGGPPQAGLPAARTTRQRQARVRAQRFPARSDRALDRPAPRACVDRSLVLVDDVMTTGATLDACARVLLEAGARSVSALTVARAVAGPPARSPRTPHL